MHIQRYILTMLPIAAVLFSLCVSIVFAENTGLVSSASIPSTKLNLNPNNYSSLDNWSQPGSRWQEVKYEKCIPVNQCRFNDCESGLYNSKKNAFCLPVEYSTKFTFPAEHTQASSRLPDARGNAYFMFSNSQDHHGYVWVVEVRGINILKPQYVDNYTSAQVVWWRKYDKCSKESLDCNYNNNEGIFNHPARISRLDNIVAIALQNFENYGVPKKYRHVGADAVAFYDVSDPAYPKFLHKLVSNDLATWGGEPPGEVISEVAIARVGEYFHLTVGDKNRRSYRMRSLLDTTVYPIISDLYADSLTVLHYDGVAFPAKIDVSISSNWDFDDDGFEELPINFELTSERLTYNTLPNNLIQPTTQIASVEDSSNHGVVSVSQTWQYEACSRAWGFQALKNGSFNVVCHHINPQDNNKFLVRNINP